MYPKTGMLKINSILVFAVLTLLFQEEVSGQIGGLGTYQFLNLSQSPRLTALGGVLPSVGDDDIVMAVGNPALLNAKMQGKLSVNHRFYVADIAQGSVLYGMSLDSTHTILLGVQYVNYGDFVRADLLGNRNGVFGAKEVAFVVGANHQLDDRLRVGINLKYVTGRYDVYQSSGVGGDIGLHYSNPDNRSDWSLVLRNMGGEIGGDLNNKETFPIDLQLGYAKRLEHLPFRYFITARNIQRWQLTYESEVNGDNIIINNQRDEESGMGQVIDNFFRHIVMGGELLIGPREAFRLRMGYSHQRKKELAVAGYRSLSGFSFGFGFNVKNMKFDYGYGRYHLEGSAHHIGLSFDLNALLSIGHLR